MQATMEARKKWTEALGVVIVLLLLLAFLHNGQLFYRVLVQQGIAQGRLFRREAAPKPSGEKFSIWAMTDKYVDYEVIAGALFFAGISALLGRMFFTRRVLEFLYVDSAQAEGRTYLGFLTNALLVLLQVGLVFCILGLAQGAGVKLLSLALGALLAVNAVWLFYVYLWAGKEDRPALRGAWWAALVSVLFFAIVILGQWFLEIRWPKELPLWQPTLVGGASLVICTADAYVQARVYGKRKPVGALRLIVTGLILVGLIVLAVLLA